MLDESPKKTYECSYLPFSEIELSLLRVDGLELVWDAVTGDSSKSVEFRRFRNERVTVKEESNPVY